MGKFWRWLTMTDLKQTNSPAGISVANFHYLSRLNVRVDISGDIDYVLRMLPIVAKQLEAADGRLTDAA